MHHLMLVTLSLENGGSAEARDSAYSLLSEDDSFVGDGCRFGCPLADWFVIGGRWSGLLRQTLLGDRYQDALKQVFPDFAKGYYPAELAKLHKDGLDKLWHRLGGTGANPLTRSSYDHYGADDDAMLVSPPLYDRFLKRVAGTADYIDGDSFGDFADLDFEEVDESFIGRKWLVVVDYHT
ncbi:MAG TPA: hypothetical protein VNX28_10030 [Gemmataceae bacterium]|jgi:hypothetical protein|nr:hypothetical protein [Gemmataceae bacterium]